MKTFDYVIQDELGIHARPAGLLVKEAKQFASKIKMEAKGKEVDVTKLIQLMSCAVKQGDKVTFKIDGADEDKAAEALETFMKNNL